MEKLWHLIDLWTSVYGDIMQVYKITNIINNKIYIGKDTKNRNDYFGSGIIIRNAIKKYGKSNFKKEILQECQTLEELNKSEIFWINVSNSIKPNGYNIAKGGNGGDTFSNRSEESKMITRKKISEKLKGHITTEETKRKIAVKNKINSMGHIHSEEQKKKIGLAHKGMKRSKETCNNISISLKGKVLSQEHKNKIKLSHIGLKQSFDTISKRNKSMENIRQSEEYRKKLSEATKLFWQKRKLNNGEE